MTEEQKKAVTKWLGECWHEEVPVTFENYGSGHICSCGQAQFNPYMLEYHIERNNRTFTEPADFFAVFDRLVEKGLYVDFDEWCFQQWTDQRPFNDMSRNLAEFTIWLLSKNPDGTYRLCSLVAEWVAKQQP